MPRRAVGLLLLLSSLLATCGPRAMASPPASSATVPEALADLPRTTVEFGGRVLLVAVADDAESRSRGLMEVDDLGSLDGLLFVYPSPTATSFHMRDVPMPLDVGFFDEDGTLLEMQQMAVCEAEPCPAYRPPGPIRWALETEVGGLDGLETGATMRVAPWPTGEPGR